MSNGESEPKPNSGPGALLVRAGVASWSIVGIVVVVAIVVLALAAITEIVIPIVFAALLAVVFKPFADRLVRRGLRPSAAAGLVIVVLGVALGAVAFAMVHGVTSQASEIGNAVTDALKTIEDKFGIDAQTLTDVRHAIADAGPAAAGAGIMTKVVSGIGSLFGFLAGLLLGILVFYYLIKDGTLFRRRFVEAIAPGGRADVDDFVSESCSMLRSYWHARTILSAIVALTVGVASVLLGLPLVLSIVVITFIGGYIPYIGAVIAGIYATLIALSDGGIGAAIAIIVVQLVANIVLENFVEPKVMSQNLDIHPLVVLIVTALGGMIGGITGLVIAVPLYVFARSAFVRLRERGLIDEATARAVPVAKSLLADE